MVQALERVHPIGAVDPVTSVGPVNEPAAESRPVDHPIDIDDSWSIGGKPHGGYLLRALAEHAVDEGHPHVMAVSAHYLSSPSPGPAVASVERLRTGRSVASSRASLVQDGRRRVEALVTAGRYDPGAEARWTDSEPPALPPVEDCPRSPVEAISGFTVGVLRHVDLHLDPAVTGWWRGEPGGQAEVRGWARMSEGRDATPLDLLVIADTLPPVTFELGLAGWVPTVELTVLVRGVPAPGWLRVVQRARLLQDGWLDEECDVWDARGRLVCQARQLAGFRG